MKENYQADGQAGGKAGGQRFLPWKTRMDVFTIKRLGRMCLP